MRILVALLITLVAGLVTMPAHAVAAPPRYAVVFEINAEKDGKLASVVVSEVMDAASGSTKPIDLKAPDEFVAAVRQSLAQRSFKPNEHYFTYFYLDPNEPTNIGILAK